MARKAKGRRRARKARDTPRGWSERIGAAVLPLVLLAAAYYAVFRGEYSEFEVRAARAAVAEERAVLDGLRTQIDSLEARADSLENDPATIERVARERFGMIREGETLYRFVPDSTDGAGATSPIR